MPRGKMVSLQNHRDEVCHRCPGELLGPTRKSIRRFQKEGRLKWS